MARVSVISIALGILQEAKQPLQDTEIVGRMQARGWVCTAQNPHRIVQATLHGYCKAHNNAGEIIFLGQSTYVAREFLGNNSPFQIGSRPRNGATTPGKAGRVELDMQNLTCGGCFHMEYMGVNQITHQCGACNAWEVSNRPANCSDAPACPHWRRRTAGQISRDKWTINDIKRNVNKTGFVRI